jgi:hypothetical protein
MKPMRCRLANLEKGLRLPSRQEQLVEAALARGAGDFMFNGRERPPCPNAAKRLEQSDLPITFYTGMSLAMLGGGRPPFGMLTLRSGPAEALVPPEPAP